MYRPVNITIISNGEKACVDFSGESTDVKPTALPPYALAQGSSFHETDTGYYFCFTESSQTWEYQFSTKMA